MVLLEVHLTSWFQNQCLQFFLSYRLYLLHSKGGCSEFRLINVLKDTAYPVGRQDRHFYFRLFLLLRKASNATIKLPKDIFLLFFCYIFLQTARWFSGIVYANFPLSIIGFKNFPVRYVRFLYPT